jgi:membrane protease YdiL (CAAX protease family)
VTASERTGVWVAWGVVVASLLVTTSAFYTIEARIEQVLIEHDLEGRDRHPRQIPPWLATGSAAAALACIGTGLSRHGRAALDLRCRLTKPSRLGPVYLRAFSLYLLVRAVCIANVAYLHWSWWTFDPRWYRFGAAIGFTFAVTWSIRGPLAEWGWTRGDGILRELAIGALLCLCYRPLVSFVARMDAELLSSPRFWSSVVAAPLVEETIYRGMLYRHLRDRWAWPIATAASAVLFAVAHLPIRRWPYVFVSGVVYALLREWRGSLLAPVAAHAGANLLVVLLPVR